MTEGESERQDRISPAPAQEDNETRCLSCGALLVDHAGKKHEELIDYLVEASANLGEWSAEYCGDGDCYLDGEYKHSKYCLKLQQIAGAVAEFVKSISTNQGQEGSKPSAAPLTALEEGKHGI